MSKIIYLDNHATTPVDPRVLKAMLPYFKECFGNAASRSHSFGSEAFQAVEKARAQVAALINAEPWEIIFTSGATESNNLALKGAAEANRGRGDHVITLTTEHRSVFDSCKRLEMTGRSIAPTDVSRSKDRGLERSGFRVTYLPVRSDGLIDLSQLKKAVTLKTILISVLLAHNEIGVIQPLAEIGRLARAKGILLHSDAAQALGKIPLDVKKMNVDLLSITAHKIHGPKGIGALYLRKTGPQVRLLPLMDGGGHEGGFRSGTLNVPGIVGFGEACRIYSKSNRLKRESVRLAKLRNRLKDKLLKEIKGCRVNGSLEFRLPNNLNVSFDGVDAKTLMTGLKGIALSSGSACLSTSDEPSYVLKALGISEDRRRSSVRFGLGRFNTTDDIDRAARQIIRVMNEAQ